MQESFWKRHLDKIGATGSVITALCCLGLPALLAFLAAIGLGFLINDAVLIPLLIVFLGVTLWGLFLGVRHHGNWWAFALGAAGVVPMLVSLLLGSAVMAAVGIGALIGASVLNVALRVRRPQVR